MDYFTPGKGKQAVFPNTSEDLKDMVVKPSIPKGLDPFEILSNSLRKTLTLDKT